MSYKLDNFKYHITVERYLELKDMYYTAYSNGFYYDKKEKEWVEENKFKKRYPIPISLWQNKGNSSDTRKQWMAG